LPPSATSFPCKTAPPRCWASFLAALGIDLALDLQAAQNEHECGVGRVDRRQLALGEYDRQLRTGDVHPLHFPRPFSGMSSIRVIIHAKPVAGHGPRCP
jgi:hypothetical protein